MNDTLKLILSLSLSGSILALIIFALKPLMKNRLSRTVQYYIWLVVLLRLLVPLSFEGNLIERALNTGEGRVAVGTEQVVLPEGNRGEAQAPVTPNTQGSPVSSVDNTARGGMIFVDILNRYALYLWILGAAVVLTYNMTGYFRFSRYMREESRPAEDWERSLLESLLRGRKGVSLLRSPFAATPLLMGIIRPCIIIPDVPFTQNQLRNILLHELTHLRRFDIGIKWLTMLAASVHWFNPLMYPVKREVNRACELSCDEGVIKNLTSTEKQAYGDTLISVVAEHRYPVGVLQATMCEEKKSLRERLMAIMKHRRKSRAIIILSGILLIVFMTGALFLGGGFGVGLGGSEPPKLYIGTENDRTRTARTGAYSWSYFGRVKMTDTAHPTSFEYRDENIVSAYSGQQLVLGTQGNKMDRRYSFTLQEISVFRNGQQVKFETLDPSFTNRNLYLQAPTETGEYIYVLRLEFKNRGTVTYGFMVRVGMQTYDLAEISKYKTPYIGNHTKVGGIIGKLPVPDSYFRQQYIAMETKSKPYKLTVYYEKRRGAVHSGEWPISTPESPTYTNMRRNALVLFAMIDNLEEVSFAYRDSESQGVLDRSKYTTSFNYSRASIKEVYGDPVDLGENLELLQWALQEKDSTAEDYSWERALGNGDVVYVGGKIYNSHKLEEFYDKYKGNRDGFSDKLRIVTYMMKGDPVIYDITADSQGARLVVDSRSDEYSFKGVHEAKVTDMVKEVKDGETIYRFDVEGNRGSYSFYVR